MAEPTQEPGATVPGRTRVARVARTALMVQGLAWVAGICVAVFHSLYGLPRTDTDVPLVYSGIVFTVLLVWSLCLAIRSLVYRENSGLAVFAISGFLVTVTAVSLIPWFLAWRQFGPNGGLYAAEPWIREALYTGWPLFVPLVSLTVAFAAPAARWLTGKLEKRATAKGRPAWAPGRWRKCWLVCFACFVLALIVGVCPFPFYFYAVETEGLGSYVYVGPEDWRGPVPKVMPDYVKCAVYRMVMALPLNPKVKLLQDKLIQGGDLRASLLRPYLLGTDQGRAGTVWQRMELLCPEEIRGLATAIGKGNVKAPLSDEEYLAGRYIAECSTVEESRAWIKGYASAPPGFTHGLLQGLQRKEHARLFTDDVVAVARANSPCRQFALEVLLGYRGFLAMAKEEDCERLWRSFALDPDPVRRREAVGVLVGCSRPSHSKLLLLYLDDTDLLVRRNAFEGAFYNGIPTELEAAWARRLLRLLDDQDLGLRRGAVHVLAQIPGLWPGSSLATPPSRYSAGMATILGGPETPEEIEELKRMRATAEEWLKKHEEAGAGKR